MIMKSDVNDERERTTELEEKEEILLIEHNLMLHFNTKYYV